MTQIGFGDRKMRDIGFSMTELLEKRLNAYNLEIISLKIKIDKHENGKIQMSSPQKEREKLKNRRKRLKDIIKRLIPTTINKISKAVQNLSTESIISLSRGRDK